jgi:HK97 family phage portal protein
MAVTVRSFAESLVTPSGRSALRTQLYGYQTSPKKIPADSTAAVISNQGASYVIGDRGRVGKPRAQSYRRWAEGSEWVRAAIDVRKTQVSQSEWDIAKFDPDGPDPSPALVQRIRDQFQQPSPTVDSFRSFIEPIIEDILVLDAGVIEKERTLRGDLVYLHPVDGAQIRVNAYWDGTDPGEARYFWYPDMYERARFTNADMVYMMENPATYRVVGLSKLETLRNTIDAELSGHAYNNRQVVNAAPDGMLDLGEGARAEQIDAFKAYWTGEVAGRGAMAFIGGSKNAKFIPFRSSNREMQFLEWQMYLVRKICAVFGLSTMDLAIAGDSNRATADAQSEQTEDRGLRPLLGLIQNYLTREIVWDPTFGGPSNNICFKFTRLNLKESYTRAQINRNALAGVSWKTTNEARRDDGLEPLVGAQYDSLMVITPTGAVTLDEVPSASESMSSKDKPAPAGPPSGGTSKPTGGSKPPSGNTKKEH